MSKLAPRSARSAPTRTSAEHQQHAQVFAALGDTTRLALLSRLGSGPGMSITQLAVEAPISRQAVTKHLRLLERAKLVRCVRQGRESVYQLDPAPLMELSEYLSLVSHQWDGALSRLKAFVETEEPPSSR